MILTSYSYKYKKNLHQTPWTSCKANGFFRCYNFNNWESTICQYTCIKNRIFISFDFFEHLKCFPFKMTPLPIMWLGSLFEQTWVLHHLRMIPHKVKFFWPIFLYRSLCTNLTPFHSLWPNSFSVEHDLNKFESSIPEYASTQVTNFLAIWFLTTRRFLKNANQFFNNSWLSPLLKRACLLFAGMVVVSLVEITPVFLEKMLKMGNVYDDNISNDNCDRRQRNFDRKSSQLIAYFFSSIYYYFIINYVKFIEVSFLHFNNTVRRQNNTKHS